MIQSTGSFFMSVLNYDTLGKEWHRCSLFRLIHRAGGENMESNSDIMRSSTEQHMKDSLTDTKASHEAGRLPVVQFVNVSKVIGGKTLIDHLTLDIPAGKVFGFLGPNGAGKTTTIRMMVGLMSMTEGDILIEGQSIRTHFEEAIAKVGAIVENPEMYKYMTGRQNLMQYARMSPGVEPERIDEVIQFVGLTGRVHEKVSTYSLGMRQRLGVAQALLHRPKLLILDEPTNGLDPQGIRELRDYLRALTREQGTTVFVSSHLLAEMELMCDAIAVIDGGKLIDVRELHTTQEAEADLIAKITVVFELDQPELAVQLTSSGKVEGNTWTIEADRQEVAQLNTLFVQNGIAVYAIRPIKRSLEDQFLELTRGGQL